MSLCTQTTNSANSSSSTQSAVEAFACVSFFLFRGVHPPRTKKKKKTSLLPTVREEASRDARSALCGWSDGA